MSSIFHAAPKPLRDGAGRARVLYLRRHGWCLCGQPLASKCSCLDCLVRNREAARRRTRAKRMRDCLSRRLEAERRNDKL